ncbi:MAG: hypothetical protein AAEJ46_09505 [Planctomycetota bacterium]
MIHTPLYPLMILILIVGSSAEPAADLEIGPVMGSINYPAGVAWWGTWEGARVEASRSGKPILLLSAAPQCHGVPGIW